jgi:hypothetical protein
VNFSSIKFLSFKSRGQPHVGPKGAALGPAQVNKVARVFKKIDLLAAKEKPPEQREALLGRFLIFYTRLATRAARWSQATL